MPVSLGAPGRIVMRRVVMTSGAALGREYASAGRRAARIFEKLFGPEIAHDLAHIPQAKRRRSGGHSGLVLPHRDGDIGQRFAFEP